MHSEARSWIALHATKAGRVLDVGGRDVNGTPRDLFGPDYTVVDIAPGSGIDVVADGARLPFPSRSFGVVVCAEVLEHTPKWIDVVSECWRVLAPGGRLIITTAGPGRPAHSATNLVTMAPGEYYGNIHPGALTELLSHLSMAFAVDVLGDDVRAIAYA